jgi:hypothetical protein
MDVVDHFTVFKIFHRNIEIALCQAATVYASAQPRCFVSVISLLLISMYYSFSDLFHFQIAEITDTLVLM